MRYSGCAWSRVRRALWLRGNGCSVLWWLSPRVRLDAARHRGLTNRCIIWSPAVAATMACQTSATPRRQNFARMVTPCWARTMERLEASRRKSALPAGRRVQSRRSRRHALTASLPWPTGVGVCHKTLPDCVISVVSCACCIRPFRFCSTAAGFSASRLLQVFGDR